MNMKEYYELFRYLAEQRCLSQSDILFVGNVAAWCREFGIPEADGEKPLKLAMKKEGGGCRMVIKEDVPEEVIESRIRAMAVRDQLQNVALDRAAILNSKEKKLAYLFLHEYAFSLPEVGDDEILADNWAFGEMKRLGYFRK